MAYSYLVSLSNLSRRCADAAFRLSFFPGLEVTFLRRVAERNGQGDSRRRVRFACRRHRGLHAV